MATILPFSSIKDYLDLEESSRKAFLDTNILISYSHDTDKFHDETMVLVYQLDRYDFRMYCNTTTRSEFMDYQRRLIITEELAWFSKELQGISQNSDMAKLLKSHRAKVRRRADENDPLVLSDKGIKNFKRKLSCSFDKIENLWLYFCFKNLSSKLETTWSLTCQSMKLEYLSLRQDDVSPDVVQKVEWKEVYKISETTGLSMSDSMILNIFLCTNIPYLFTTDFDLIYAASIIPSRKYVFCPDNMYKRYFPLIKTQNYNILS
ncbi:MAG: hypothetical protein OXB88_02770 [Bacteriovoracales bacterium]|nr:hypothetical protein [Bacteriovoracales bacterium]